MKALLAAALRPTAILIAAPLLLVGCGGPATNPAGSNVNGSRIQLQSISIGRLVDVYAYQRVDASRADRRDQMNRRPVLVQENVVVRSGIETQALFDLLGEADPTANYEFLPFDVDTGHEELMILWDNRGDEAANFDAAFAAAQSGLTEIPGSVRTQNTSTRPIPVVPRDAAIVLQFNRPVGVDETFFSNNDAALQLLEFNGDPHVVAPADAFREVQFRLIVRGSQIVLDPTILGGEVRGGFLSSGLPESLDNTTANIRIALPTRGSASPKLFVAQDPNDDLNDVDSTGRNSVVRDFRSGNANDGPAGHLRDLEPPAIVGHFDMGITDIDANGVITVNKHLNTLQHPLYIHGRFPFVGGALSLTTGLALGPSTAPIRVPLRSGDFLEQTVTVILPDGTPETVRIKAEILQNLDIGTFRDDPAFPALGFDAPASGPPTQGDGPTARLVIGTIRGKDSLGRPVTFVANSTPLGEPCELKKLYIEHASFTSGTDFITDANHRLDFLTVVPPPTSAGLIDPTATAAIEFSEPMDLQRVDPTKNLLMTQGKDLTHGVIDQNLIAALGDPKRLSFSVVPVRWSDQSGDGTVVQLQPPKGLFHVQGSANDKYWFHVVLGDAGLADLGGNSVQVFNDVAGTPSTNWSAPLLVDSTKPTNNVGWRVYPFESADEDGTLPGSIDIFGQFQLLDGRLRASPAVRFSQTADENNLRLINRANRGECPPPGQAPYNPNNGAQLYWTPKMLDTVVPPNVPNPYPNFQIQPQPVGHVVEPHQIYGSHLQMRYIEDDFSLGNRQPSTMAIDVEQLYWSPFAGFDVLFDVFDRYSMALAHSDKRPDLHWTFLQPPGNPPPPLTCTLDCPSVLSSLSLTFADNVLRGSAPVSVFEDKVYRIDPNSQFLTSDRVKYIAYPKFDHTYTWRDSRLVSVDSTGAVVGLGGARDPGDPNALTLTNDWTANVDSPWVPSASTNSTSGLWAIDDGDFWGNRRRDHDPIALPLLVDFRVYPDGPVNNLANGSNGFQVAMLGPPSAFPANPPSPGGYYNLVGSGCPQADPWPLLRVHTSGSLNPVDSAPPIIVDPANAPVATTSWVKDSGAIVMAPGSPFSAPKALVQVAPGDGMLHWARADFVRKVSTMTFGFFDTTRPNLHAALPSTPTLPADVDLTGFPSVADTLRVSEFTTLLDPPLGLQPAGTSTVFEIRGCADFPNATLYDTTIFTPATTGGPVETYANRGNLLNPNFACEAYRYSQANSGVSNIAPRLSITGLTKYVTEDRLEEIVSLQNGLLPRYLNFRLVMTNNVSVTPAVSPSLRSLCVVYRLQ